MIRKNKTFRLAVTIIFCSFFQSVYSQKQTELNTISTRIETAFETSNWEKVIQEGKLYSTLFDKKKLNKKDYSTIIESLDVYYKMAVAYCWLNKTDSANIILEKFNFKKASFPLHQTYNDFYKISTQASIAFINNKTADSEKLFVEALRIANKQLKQDFKAVFISVNNLATQYISEYELNKAIKLIYKAIIYFDRYKAPQTYAAQMYYLLYLTNYFDANYQSAHENAKQCLFLLQKSTVKEQSFLAAKAQLAIGICLFHLKEYNYSKETLHQAWQLFNKFEYLTNQEFALNLNYLGRVYYALENYTLAMEYKLKTYKIFEEIYQSPSHYRVLQVGTSRLYAIDNRVDLQIEGIDSETYEQLTNLEYVFKHLPVDYQNMSANQQLYYYSQQALTYVRLEQFSNAIRFLKKGWSLKMKTLPEHHVVLRPWYKLIGSCYSSLGKQDSAIFYYKKAIESFKLEKELPQHANRKSNDYEKNPELINLFYLVGNSYFLKAKQEGNNKKSFERALVYFKNGDMLATQISAVLNNREDKLLLTSYMDDVYTLGIACCFNLSALTEDPQEKENFYKQAFVFSQRSKASRLEEMVINFDIRKRMGLPEQIIKQEQEIKNKISYWEKAISQRTIVNAKNFEHPITYYRRMIGDKMFNNSEASDSLFKYIGQHNLFMKRLEQKFPNYFNLMYAQKVYQVEEIQNLLDTSSVLVDYHHSGAHLEIFVISKNKFSAYRIETPENLKVIIDDYNYSLSGYYKKAKFINKAMDVFIKNGNSLHKYLIEPIKKEIKNKEKLIIIVSEELSLLPFETIASNNGTSPETDLSQLDYLIKRHEIVYNYSSNLWVESVEKSLQNKSKTNNFLGLAPVFDPDKMYVTGLEPQNDDVIKMQPPADKVRLSKLAATKKAIDDISLMANKKGMACSTFFYQNASKSRFLNEVGNKKYVVLATHGKADFKKPELSRLYFAHDSSSTNFLSSSETYNLNLNNDILVLFACETGIGQIKKGEGVMSLSRGFMASGAANVVHSLWSIQDVSTKDIVVGLFEGVFNSKNYSSSLRKAKLKMMEYGVIPFHWAGLVLIGN